MNIKNKTVDQLRKEIPGVLNHLPVGVLYNFSIRKVPNMSKEPEWFKKYRKEFESFRDDQQEFNKNQQEFNLKLVNRLEAINIKVDNIDNRLKRIESLPTIRNELNNL